MFASFKGSTGGHRSLKQNFIETIIRVYLEKWQAHLMVISLSQVISGILPNFTSKAFLALRPRKTSSFSGSESESSDLNSESLCRSSKIVSKHMSGLSGRSGDSGHKMSLVSAAVELASFSKSRLISSEQRDELELSGSSSYL